MKSFSFTRFVALLARVLEIGVIAALALRWLDALLDILLRVQLPRAAADAAFDFSFLAIVVLLAADLWLLVTRQPRAIAAGWRVLLYIALFMLTPYRLGGSARDAASSPNQAMERTPKAFASRLADRRTLYF